MPSAWGWFTGADKAKKEAMATAGQNKGYIGEGLQNQLGYYSGAKNEAQGYLSPYAQQGGQANTQYGNLLGLNGAGAQEQAQQGWQGWNKNLGNDITLADRMIDRRNNAAGNGNSGLNALARQRSAMELSSRDFYNYNDRLQGQGAQGFGAAGAMAGNSWNYAQNAGNAQQGATQGYVGNNTNLGNALSASNISPMNFMMQNAQMAISALGGGKGNNYSGGK